MKKVRTAKRFLINGVVLAATSMLIRFVSVSFNVYLSNKLGAAGMGLLSLILSIYGFGITFAISGISFTTTRLVAEAMGKNSDAEIRAAMKKCLSYSFGFGFTAWLIMFSFAKPIGLYLLMDSRTVNPVRVLAFTLPVVSLCSVLNGYFTACRRIYKNAISTIFDQAVYICLTILGLYLLLPKGVEGACIAVLGGSCLAEVLCLGFTFIMYQIDLHKHNKNKGDINPKLTKKMFGIALPVAFSAYVRSALSTIEHLLIPRGLKKSGSSKEGALAIYGTIHAMVLPIVLFPSSILSSFTGLLVPELAECRERGDTAGINRIAARVMQIALLFSIGTAGIIICFATELGYVIYDSKEAATYIRILAPLIPIMYFDTSTDFMLKGLNEQVYSMRVNILDSALGVLLVIFLLPSLGIKGYIIEIFVCELINVSLSVYRLINIIDVKVKFYRWILLPLACIIGSTYIVKIFAANVYSTYISEVAELILSITLTVIVYFALLVLTSSVTKADLRWAKGIFKRS